MYNIVIGKRSNLTNYLIKNSRINRVFQSKEIHSSKFDKFLINYKGKINIIFNSFFPLHLMNDFNSKLFLTQSQLTPLLFVSSLKKNLKINKKLKINKIILSSSSSIYTIQDNIEKSKRNYYACIKQSNESLFLDLCADTKIDLIIARIFNMYGGRDKFSIIRKLFDSYHLKEKIFISNQGMSVRDFIHVEDVANIYFKLLDSKIKGVVNVGSGKGYSINNLINYVGKKKLNITYNNIKKKIDYSDISISSSNITDKLNINLKHKIPEYFKKKFKIKGKQIFDYYGRNNQDQIILSPPSISFIEKKYVEQSLNSNWIAPIGPAIDEFEKKLSINLNNQYVTALNSGTSALHLALKILNVNKDDIVLCQSFTFAGTAYPIIYQGAIPVFIDSEKNSWNIDPFILEKAIKDFIKKKKKPKCIIAVDLYGMPANYKILKSISNKYKIPIIEDAAEALGSSYDNNNCGTFGKFSILSFNGNKIITTGGGGALISDSKKDIDLAKYYSTQAREKKIYYEHKKIGYNYRLSNISASIGSAQLEKLSKFVKRRREIFNFYKNILSKFEFIDYQSENYSDNIKIFSNRWLSTFVFNNKNKRKLLNNIFETMNENNIEVRPLWKPMHMQPVFKKCKFYNNNISKNLFDSGICLPSGSNMNDNELFKVSDILYNCIKKI